MQFLDQTARYRFTLTNFANTYVNVIFSLINRSKKECKILKLAFWYKRRSYNVWSTSDQTEDKRHEVRP